MTGHCSAECGGGTRTNTRTKKVRELYGGTCDGDAQMVEACNEQECTGNRQIVVYEKQITIHTNCSIQSIPIICNIGIV